MNKGKVITSIYLVLELFIYISFTTMDILYSNYYLFSNQLKYISIILCFIYVYAMPIIFKQKREESHTFLLIALFFTSLADYYLLLTDESWIGVIFFILVQFMYQIYMIHINQIPIDKTLLRRGVSCSGFVYGIVLAVYIVTLIILIAVGKSFDLTIVITSFYILYFICNLFRSIRLYRKNKEWNEGQARVKISLYFMIGLILYFICDILVGIYNMSSYINLEEIKFLEELVFLKDVMFLIDSMFRSNMNSWVRWIQVGIWLFYLPGKVLICLSLYEYCKKVSREDMVN